MHLLRNTLLEITIDIIHVLGDVAVRRFEVDREFCNSNYILLWNLLLITVKCFLLMLLINSLSVLKRVAVLILFNLIKVRMYLVFSGSRATARHNSLPIHLVIAKGIGHRVIFEYGSRHHVFPINHVTLYESCGNRSLMQVVNYVGLFLIQWLLLADVDLALAVAHHWLIKLILKMHAITWRLRPVSLRRALRIQRHVIAILPLNVLIVLAHGARIRRIIIHFKIQIFNLLFLI